MMLRSTTFEGRTLIFLLIAFYTFIAEAKLVGIRNNDLRIISITTMRNCNTGLLKAQQLIRLRCETRE